MADAIRIEVINAEAVQVRIDGMGDELQQLIAQGLGNLAGDAQGAAREKIHSRSGRLAEAILAVEFNDPDVLGITLWIDTDLAPYGRAIEEGADLPAHEIVPSQASALTLPIEIGEALVGAGIESGRTGKASKPESVSFLAHVEFPGGTIEAQHPIALTIEELVTPFTQFIESAIDELAGRST